MSACTGGTISAGNVPPVPHRPDQRVARPIASATVATITAVLPVLLFGALSVVVRDDIEFTDTQIGFAVSAFFLASTMSSTPGGRLADRIGPYRSTSIGVTASAVSLVALAVAPTAWWHVAGLLLLAGLASGVTIPASNLTVARHVPATRQGFAFGLKQAAIPTAGVLAGFSVPFVGLTVGWRWAFAGAAATLGAVYVASSPRSRGASPTSSIDGGHRAPMLPMIMLAVTAALASGAATATLGFFVPSAVGRGFEAGTAGFLLAGGSIAGIGARIAWGWLADRRGHSHLAFLAGLFAAGSLGFALLGVVETVPLLAATTFIVFVAGWSWSGLLFMVAALGSPGAPATATGIASTGGGAGGLIGPPVFGLVVERASYAAAWTMVATWMITAAALALVTLHTWRRILATRTSAEHH